VHDTACISKTALITGASSGIGASTSLLLARKGIHVVLTARRIERLNKLKAEIDAFDGSATVIQADLSSESDRDLLYKTLLNLNLLPDILVNNAGLAWYGYFHEMPWTIADEIVKLNIEASTHLTLLFLPHMLEQKYGRIINIGSIAGKMPEQGIAVYSASKAYLDAFTTSIHRDLKGSGVSVSVLRAGPVKTEFFATARSLENGGSVPAERFAISVDRVSAAIWHLVQHPSRVLYVPFYLALSPLLELLFSAIIDQLGPLLLNNRKTTPL
jgi:hypothetical protein